MSVNRYRPHVLILPEDDANRQLANGFILNRFVSKQVDVLAPAGGWMAVVNSFLSVHASEMDSFPERSMVLLIDFDGDANRRSYIKEQIPEHLIDRVFVLGASNEPQHLKRAGLGSYEEIGSKLADDLHEDTNKSWGHALLSHNEDEKKRLCQRVPRESALVKKSAS